MSNEINSVSSGEGTESVAAAGSPVGEGAQGAAAPVVSEQTAIAEKINKHSAGKAAAKATQTATKPVGGQEGVNTPAGQNPAISQAQEQAVAAYQANYKFKFRNQEREIPELFRGVMKDAESEKMVRDLHERASWLEEMKPQYQQQNEKLSGLTKGLEVLDKHLQNKDYGKFFDAFGLTDELIFEYAKNRLEYHQLPEDQRAKMDAEMQLKERAMTLEQQNEILQEQQEAFQAQQKDGQLRGIMGHPQVSPIVERHPGGQQGFYRDVAQHAWFIEQTTGQDLTPEQAVVSYIQQRGLYAQQPSGMAAAPAQMAPQGIVQSQQRAPTIPTIPSQGASPAKKMVSSMKDLRAAKARAEAQANG